MTERRMTQRQRSYLGGRIAFNARASAMDCLVRDISPAGARLICSSAVALPDAFDLTIPCKGMETRVNVIWRRGEEMGIVFAQRSAGSAEVISLDSARRLRECERERNRLRARVEELLQSF